MLSISVTMSAEFLIKAQPDRMIMDPSASKRVIKAVTCAFTFTLRISSLVTLAGTKSAAASFCAGSTLLKFNIYFFIIMDRAGAILMN